MGAPNADTIAEVNHWVEHPNNCGLDGEILKYGKFSTRATPIVRELDGETDPTTTKASNAAGTPIMGWIKVALIYFF